MTVHALKSIYNKKFELFRTFQTLEPDGVWLRSISGFTTIEKNNNTRRVDLLRYEIQMINII